MILCPSLAETWPPAPGESKVVAEEREGAWAFLYMMVPCGGIGKSYRTPEHPKTVAI